MWGCHRQSAATCNHVVIVLMDARAGTQYSTACVSQYGVRVSQEVAGVVRERGANMVVPVNGVCRMTK